MDKVIIILVNLIVILSSCSVKKQLQQGDFQSIQTITSDIRSKFDVISDSNGFATSTFYIIDSRSSRKFQVLDSSNLNQLKDLYLRGIIKSVSIQDKNCISYLLKVSNGFPIVGFPEKYIRLVYNNNCDCNCDKDTQDEKVRKTEKLEGKWSVIYSKNTHVFLR